jgi:DNA-directed RNA polymerase subunit beta'
VELENDGEGRRLRVVSREELREDYALPDGAQLLVDEGEYVEPGMILARMMTPLTSGNGASEPEEPHPTEEVIANIGGRVELSSDGISIVWEDVEEREHMIPASAYILVSNGASIKAGDALTAGPLNPHDILHIRGKDELQRYLVDEVQQVYRSQGVSIHDKHIEIILRQMLRRVQVESTGDSDFIPGQMVDKFEFQEKNAKVLAEGGEPATAKPVLLGVTRASLLTDSFLAAASFQETTRVLTQAAVSGAHDWLLGLKENVIIGRLIPARLESLSMVEEPEPEALRGMEDMIPAAGWLDIANEATNQYAIEVEGQRPQDRPFLIEEREDDLLGDDEEEDHLLNGRDTLFAEESESEGNGFSPLSPFEDEDSEDE